ncbi:sortase [Halobacillus litoralis]|uniref:Sortase n=1 Tax=Halobacillus litoralis TaxID=45668 RepID=A0A845DUX9_9BACI|nr:class F sortase [Halobacillus litoralis]MYL21216.1 sortase [Halobacillus litoralis]
MKRVLTPVILGLFVFFASYFLLSEEPLKEAGVLSTSSQDEFMKETKAGEKEARDALENEPIQQNYSPAATVSPDKQQGIEPKRIEIPAIEVNAPIQALGYTDEGGMAVPANLTDTGWFEPGTKPGNQGNSVIAGHVDGRSGPAVFFDLKELSQGDEIYLYDDEGTRLTFTVEKTASYPFQDSPIRELFGPSSDQRLNLITCTGSYNQEASTYSERLVVFTVLTEIEDV